MSSVLLYQTPLPQRWGLPLNLELACRLQAPEILSFIPNIARVTAKPSFGVFFNLVLGIRIQVLKLVQLVLLVTEPSPQPPTH